MLVPSSTPSGVYSFEASADRDQVTTSVGLPPDSPGGPWTPGGPGSPDSPCGPVCPAAPRGPAGPRSPVGTIPKSDGLSEPFLTSVPVSDLSLTLTPRIDPSAMSELLISRAAAAPPPAEATTNSPTTAPTANRDGVRHVAFPLVRPGVSTSNARRAAAAATCTFARPQLSVIDWSETAEKWPENLLSVTNRRQMYVGCVDDHKEWLAGVFDRGGAHLITASARRTTGTSQSVCSTWLPSMARAACSMSPRSGSP